MQRIFYAFPSSYMLFAVYGCDYNDYYFLAEGSPCHENHHHADQSADRYVPSIALLGSTKISTNKSIFLERNIL